MTAGTPANPTAGEDGPDLTNDPGRPWSVRLLADGFDRVAEALPGAVAGLSPTAIRWQLDPAANSIGWLLWHLARVEDDHLSGVAASVGKDGGEQVWIADGWAESFGLPYPVEAIGYGQTAADVAAFDVDDAGLLLDYYGAVHRRTLAILADLTEADLGAVVDERWNPPVTAAVRLVSVVNDITAHYGQIAYLRGLHDRLPAA